MTNQFRNKLRDLRQIQPNIEWQRATRRELLERFNLLQEPKKAGFFVCRKFVPSHPFSSLFYPLSPFFLKRALVTLVILAVIFGASWLIYRELAYPLKIVEQGVRKAGHLSLPVPIYRDEAIPSQRENEQLMADRLEEKLVKIEEDLGSLPVRDNKKVIAFTFEVKKAIEEAKRYLLEKNFTMALSKLEESEDLIEKVRIDKPRKEATVPAPIHEISNPDFKIDIIRE